MQDSTPCSAYRAKTTQGDLRNVVPDFAVQKTSGSTTASHKTRWGPIQHIFSWMLIKATKNFVFFCILTYNTTLISISFKVRNVNVDFCVRIDECLLTENIYLAWFRLFQRKCFIVSSSAKVGNVVMSHRCHPLHSLHCFRISVNLYRIFMKFLIQSHKSANSEYRTEYPYLSFTTLMDRVLQWLSITIKMTSLGI